MKEAGRNLQTIIGPYVDAIEAELKRSLPYQGFTFGAFYDMMRYHMGWLNECFQPSNGGNGKRLRPVLCLLAAEAAGGDFRPALPPAAAVELLHNFTLIHDDIEDASDQRRHRPTVWKLWGVPQAINAGDGMFALSYLALMRSAGTDTAPERLLSMLASLEQAILRICEGQFLDISFEDRLDVSTDEYFVMIERKTATLIEASMCLGATAVNATPDVVTSLAEAGRFLGMAFQVKDDELGIWGDEAVTGKPTAGDIYQKKKSLPIVYALERATGESRERLTAIYGVDTVSEDQAETVLSILDDLGARSYCTGVAGSYYRQGLAELSRLAGKSAPGSLEKLRLIAESLVERTH